MRALGGHSKILSVILGRYGVDPPVDRHHRDAATRLGGVGCGGGRVDATAPRQPAAARVALRQARAHHGRLGGRRPRGGRLFSFLESKFSFPEAKFSFPEAKFSFPEAKFSFPEAKFSFLAAKLSFPEAKFRFREARFCSSAKF